MTRPANVPGGPPFTVDRSYRRQADALIGGAPLRLFRLGPAGRRVVASLERGEPLPNGHQPLTDRLTRAGVIHPRRPAGSLTGADVTVVRPAFGEAPSALGGVASELIVDDASPVPLAAPPGTTLIRRAANGGPAAARNTGLAAARSTLVAFVDSDVKVPGGWLEPLLGHFADERVAVVAPRVRTFGSGPLARFESSRSPLDLGGRPALVRPGSPVAYVPGAVLVCRRAAVDAVGGFDESLRLGEDVDLLWRLDAEGWLCRHEPAVTVTHRVRGSLVPWLAQRAAYASSAGPLAQRHRGALAPARFSPWAAAAWLALAARRPRLAGGCAAVDAALRWRRLGALPAGLRARVIVHTQLAAGRQLASGATRLWLPLTAAAMIVAPRSRPGLAGTVLAGSLTGWWRGGRPLDPARFALLHLADDAAYCAGLWFGAWRSGTAAPIIPGLRPTTVPGR